MRREGAEQSLYGAVVGAEHIVLRRAFDKAALVKEVKQALYASKICSYAQGLNIIKAKSAEKSWDVDNRQHGPHLEGMSRDWSLR